MAKERQEQNGGYQGNEEARHHLEQACGPYREWKKDPRNHGTSIHRK